jgi:REP element-mobilizing transposase RayT
LRNPKARSAIKGYLIGTVQNINCPSLIVEVVEDHVHILCNLHRTMSVAKLVEELKTSSSARIKEEGPQLADFHWQNGYGAFSVSQSNVEQVKEYIANQEEHHRVRTFQEELRLLLERHGIAYDERYVWDSRVAARWAFECESIPYPGLRPPRRRPPPWAIESAAFSREAYEHHVEKKEWVTT